MKINIEKIIEKMTSQSSSAISTPEINNYIICYICNQKISRKIFLYHYQECKSSYLLSEKAKIYPLNEPSNINELIEIISNTNLIIPETIFKINTFENLNEEKSKNIIEENPKSITPNEFLQNQKENRFRKYSMEEYKIEKTETYKKLFLYRRARLASLKLKKITEEELENTKKFTINN